VDLDEVARREWYHTLELAPGVETAGFFDHRPLLRKLPIPASLAGQRCLDIGTFDGFWAFELERRGAAEVKRNRVPWRALRAYEGRQAFIRRHAGDPHAFILARGA
jgi:hypothetical protein